MAKEKSKILQSIAMVQSSKNKAIGFSVLTIVVVVILIGGAITPSVSTIVRITGEISDKEEVLTKLEDKVSALSTLSQQYDSMFYVIEDLPLLYPSNGDYSLITANLAQITTANEFRLNSINYLDSKEDEPEGDLIHLLPQYVTLSVRGPVANFIPLIKAFEAMPMNPETVRVNYNNSPDQNGEVDYAIQLKMYRLEDELFFK